MSKSMPEWAKPGERVIMEPGGYGGYGRRRTFRRAIVTRVTKTSVFVVPGSVIPDDPAEVKRQERRFVECYFPDGDRLEAYGSRGGVVFHRSSYLWNPDAEAIKQALEVAAWEDTLDNVARAARAVADVFERDHREDESEDRRAALETLHKALGRYGNGKAPGFLR